MISVEKSKIDQSVNFIEKQLEGFLESRYVRKCDDYFICYLSSHNQCNKGCLFCHLTNSGQNGKMVSCDLNDILNQTMQVYRHYRQELIDGKEICKIVHYNWMARGEVLSNSHILKDSKSILMPLADLAVNEGLLPKFNISTIMPNDFEKRELAQVFPIIQPTVYYSLYSLNKKWRKKWIPNGMEPEKALEKLTLYQKVSKKICKLHWTFIKGENDSIEDLKAICDMVDSFELICEFNCVRYNSHPSTNSSESDFNIIQRNLEYLKNRLKNKVQMIPRVGDINNGGNGIAACGLFIDKNYKQ